VNKRRELLTALGLCALAAPLGAFAQQQGKVWRVGILLPNKAPPSPNLTLDAFRVGMREFGLVEGESYVLELRFAKSQYERLPGLAAELVRLKVDAILTNGSPATQAAQKATTTIPIVMLGVGDPVGSGFVNSLARPGGNITGFCNLASDLGPKYVDLLLGVLPELSRVAVLVNFANPTHHEALKSIQDAAQARGLKVVSAAAKTPEDIDSAFSKMSRENVGAVIVVTEPFFYQQREQIAALAIKKRLPSISGLSSGYVRAGGLMSYASNLADQYRRAGTYVAKILKGAKPADLPVEQAANLELVINLKTAKALGLTIPQVVLLRADEVIQ
jgi:putative tryptophan/tyrosine transport system substrate-binding protein